MVITMAHFCGELQREVDDQASHLEGKPQLILQGNGGNVTAAKLKQNQGWVKKQYPMTRKEQLGSNLQREFSSIKLPLRLREGWGWNGFRSFFALFLSFPHQLDAFLTIDIFSTSSEKWRLRSLSTDVRSIASTTSLWRSLSAFWRGNIVSTSEPWSVEHLNPTRWGKSQPPGQLIIC